MSHAEKRTLKLQRAQQGPDRNGDLPPAALEPRNPFARRVAELRAEFVKAISKEDLRAIVARLVADAKAGNAAAAKLLLQYGVGKPDACRILTDWIATSTTACTSGPASAT
jgi:hypothetical protein